jgi:hypothetical protein
VIETIENFERNDMSDADIETLFTYHSPTPEQVPRYQNIREAARIFARVLASNTFKSADQTAALRKLRECVMTANASIALEGKLEGNRP